MMYLLEIFNLGVPKYSASIWAQVQINFMYSLFGCGMQLHPLKILIQLNKWLYIYTCMYNFDLWNMELFLISYGSQGLRFHAILFTDKREKHSQS